jgi:asparagine synthase (glutamine-hydrolysing)
VRAAGQDVRRLIFDAVRLRLRSDVSVGVLLSGGLDSSILAAAAIQQEDMASPVQLLSAVSDDPASDESNFIDRMALHLDREVIKVRLTAEPEGIASLLECISWHNDHPVPYLGNVYLFMLMQEARARDIKVILSGQGADELFCGYGKYPWLMLINMLREQRLVAAVHFARRLHRNGFFASNSKLAEAKRYLRHLAPWLGRRLSIDPRGDQLVGFHPVDVVASPRNIVQRQVADLVRLSVPSLCHIEDRMSMAWSREVRLPYLDTRLVEAMLAAPDEHKLGEGWTKYCLRIAGEELIPAEIAWRRDKRGFSVPEAPLIMGSLGDRIGADMTPGGLVFTNGFIDYDRWQQLWRTFRERRPGWRRIASRELWAPWALEVWLRRWWEWIEAA